MNVRAMILLLIVATVGCAPAPGDEAFRRAADRAETAARIMSVAAEDSLLAAEQGRPAAERIGAWARRFAAADSVSYRFGLADGGYAAEGALVADRTHDCVSLLYRCVELAGAVDHRDAVARALGLRFTGVPLDSLVGTDGRVDYDHPEHLDYSLDMIRSGNWGRDVTASLSGAAPDSAGSARYAAGSFDTVPEGALDPTELHEGDIVWFVLDPSHDPARRLREEYGLVIGHIGIVVVEDGRAMVVHAASSGLEGVYEGGTVVMVELEIYLERVERYMGVVVTRVD